jgi:hypothetical protein
MSDNGVTVDPNLVNQAYKQMLSDSQGQVALLQAAATQLQDELSRTVMERDELKKTNQQLMADSGRQDGVPQESETSAE